MAAQSLSPDSVAYEKYTCALAAAAACASSAASAALSASSRASSSASRRRAAACSADKLSAVSAAPSAEASEEAAADIRRREEQASKIGVETGCVSALFVIHGKKYLWYRIRGFAWISSQKCNADSHKLLVQL